MTATITDWTGSYDGKVTGTYTLNAEYTLPVGYRQGPTPEVVTVNVVVSIVQMEEITGHSALAAVMLNTDQGLLDILRLKASGILPTQVKLITEAGPIDATITDWTGSYDGKVTGTYTLTAEYTLPAGYRQGATPEVVTVDVVVSTIQLEEVTGHSTLPVVTIYTDQGLPDIVRLKTSGVLPTQINLTTETGTVTATITDWTGSYDGRITGTYTLKAVYTLPVGYRQGATPEVVTVDVEVIYKEDSRVVSKLPTTLNIGDISNTYIEIKVNGIDLDNDLDIYTMFYQSSFIGDFENVNLHSMTVHNLNMSIGYSISSGTITNNTGNAILRIPVKTGNDIIVYFDTIN